MSDSTGLPPTRYSVVVTREIRWFSLGDLPNDVRSWFTLDGTVGEVEHRVDRYNLDFAEHGAGVKVRGDETLDTKRLLGAHDVDLGNGFAGRIEDWVKTMKPIPEDWHRQDGRFLSVTKRLTTRRYRLESSEPDGSAPGCEAELAELVVGDRTAWSFCLETFGDPALRQAALANGLEALLADSPIATPNTVTGGPSCGYPGWLSETFKVA